MVDTSIFFSVLVLVTPGVFEILVHGEECNRRDCQSGFTTSNLLQSRMQAETQFRNEQHPPGYGVPKIKPEDMDVCKSDSIIIISGWPHSGTSIIQHQLLSVFGQFNASAGDTLHGESWPTGCPVTSTVTKMPILSAQMARWFLAYRRVYPNARMVWMKRDLPNAVWSQLKSRKAEKNFTEARELATSWCEINELWSKAPKTDIDIELPLAVFTENVDHYLEAISGQSTPLSLVSGPLKGRPDDTNHRELRTWQVQEPVYKYDYTVYLQESSPEMAAFLANYSC